MIDMTEFNSLMNKIKEKEKTIDSINSDVRDYIYGHNPIEPPIALCVLSVALGFGFLGALLIFYIKGGLPSPTVIISLCALSLLSFVLSAYLINARKNFIPRIMENEKKRERRLQNIASGIIKPKAKEKAIAENYKRISALKKEISALWDKIHSLSCFNSAPSPFASGISFTEDIGFCADFGNSISTASSTYEPAKPDYPDVPIFGSANIMEASPWTDFRTGETLYRTFDGKIVNSNGEEVSVAWWD